MKMDDWIMLVTALGGIEGIKQLVKWWVNRKTDRRISDAQADVEEFKGNLEIVRIIRAMDMSIPELEAFKKRQSAQKQALAEGCALPAAVPVQ